MSTNLAKPAKVAIIGASGTYGALWHRVRLGAYLRGERKDGR